MKTSLPMLACFAVLATVVSDAHAQYPATRKSQTTDVYHGHRVPDPYRWLESLDDPEVREWVAAQNVLTKPQLEGYGLREYFWNRIESIKAVAGPRRIRRQAGCWITARTHADGATDFFIQSSPEEEPRVLFSPSERFPDRRESVQDVYLSPNGSTLAYTSSSDGRTSLALRFYDLASETDLEDVIEDTKWGHPQWTADSRSILYQRLIRPGHTQPDGIDRESAIWRHTIGSDPSEDRPIYKVNPEDIGAGSTVEVPWPGRFVLVANFYESENSISILDLGDPQEPNFGGPVVEVTDERSGSNTVIGLVDSTVYILTTDDAPKGRIVAVDIENPSAERTIIPESQDLLERATIAGDRICVGYLKDVISKVRLHDLQGAHIADIALPTKGAAFWFSGDRSTPMMSFAFDSFTYPMRSFMLDTRSGRIEAVTEKQRFSPSIDLVTDQEFYISKDGTHVPLFVVYRRDQEDAGPRATMLYGYGASGGIVGPIFSPEWFAWIEAGGIFALANIRGGGEYGKEWYRAGCLESKQNSYDDFIAAAEHLIRQEYTTSDQLAIHGMSNGGMLVGAVMTQRPELFAAAVPVAGVLDALRFPSFTAGPRWAKSMGDPTIAEQFGWLFSWSPLHRIEDGTCYPATLITTAANDDVVHPSQSYKFAARMQEAQGCDRPIVLRVYDTGAHRADQSSPEQAADRLAFIAHHTDLAATPASVNGGKQ